MSERKEHPILFTTEMVQAVLAGKKTQTRRIINPQPTMNDGAIVPTDSFDSDYDDEIDRSKAWVACFGYPVGDYGGPPHEVEFTDFYKCPYGKPGDRLWVRETHVIESSLGVPVDDYKPPKVDGRPLKETFAGRDGYYWQQAHYKASDPAPELACEKDGHEGGPCCHWSPSIHMPRWASRIKLLVEDVRVERVQDISDADAKAEGWNVDGDIVAQAPLTWFECLWDEINGERKDGIYAWDKNPWVWVVEFKVL